LPRGRHPSTRRHVWIYNRDWAWLQNATRSGPLSNFRPGTLVREIIARHIEGKIAESPKNDHPSSDEPQPHLDL
jgi:hypothetical protein